MPSCPISTGRRKLVSVGFVYRQRAVSAAAARSLARSMEIKRLACIDPASQNPDDLALLAMGRRVRPLQRLPKPAYE